MGLGPHSLLIRVTVRPQSSKTSDQNALLILMFLGYAETGADNSTGNQDQLHAHLGSSQPGMHPVLGQTIGPMSSGDLIGPVLAGAPYSPVLDNRAVSTSQGMTQIQSHMTTGSVSPVPLSAKRVGNHSVVLSSSRRGAPAVKIGHPYIRRASAAIAASSASSDGQFATAISSTWAPHNQGTNPGFAVTPSHPDWSQPNSNHTSISARPSQSLYPQSTVSINPYVGSYGASSSGPPPHYYSPAYNSPGPLGGPFANIGLPFSMQGSQNYPSPHSAASDRASPLCPVNMSGNSPQIMQRETSPSDALSPPRRRDTSKQMNEEPPRNAQGQIYCNDPECANKNEIFARKCEWR